MRLFSQSVQHKGIRRCEPEGEARDNKCEVKVEMGLVAIRKCRSSSLLFLPASFLLPARTGRGDFRRGHQVSDVLLQKFVVGV